MQRTRLFCGHLEARSGHDLSPWEQSAAAAIRKKLDLMSGSGKTYSMDFLRSAVTTSGPPPDRFVSFVQHHMQFQQNISNTDRDWNQREPQVELRAGEGMFNLGDDRRAQQTGARLQADFEAVVARGSQAIAEAHEEAAN